MRASEVGVTLDVSACLGWWAVYTRHQHEKRVSQMLLAKGMEIFLPVYQSVRKWKDRSVQLELPLFPGYVFVRESLTNRLQIASTPGVHTIVSRGENFAVIPGEEIEALRRAAREDSGIEPHPFLCNGDPVRVIRGPLKGVRGFLVRRKNISRLVLSVEMLAQSASVEVDLADVEPARGTAEYCHADSVNILREMVASQQIHC